ncbi:MAG: hypothetical protein ACRDGQ_13000 [Candidatus Limnocylindrales bacterium]
MTARNDRLDPEIEALRVDRYLESILVARDRGAATTPYDPRLDPRLRSTAEWLSAELGRVHPSFRFEERVARRLAVQASLGGRFEGVLEGRFEAGFEPAELADPAHAVPGDGTGDESFSGHARPLLIGGALTSAALSLAGALFVAWRRSRAIEPMVQAIRDAHARTSSAAGHGTGLA